MKWNPLDFSDCKSHAEIDAQRNAGLLALAVFAIIFFASISMGSAADLPIPKPPERCLVTGEEPAPGQTLHVDKRCKSGLRWVYSK